MVTVPPGRADDQPNSAFAACLAQKALLDAEDARARQALLVAAGKRAAERDDHERAHLANVMLLSDELTVHAHSARLRRITAAFDRRQRRERRRRRERRTRTQRGSRRTASGTDPPDAEAHCHFCGRPVQGGAA
jgi:hypothetical protein